MGLTKRRISDISKRGHPKGKWTKKKNEWMTEEILGMMQKRQKLCQDTEQNTKKIETTKFKAS